ncbi:MAG TPA: AsmA-like C-terminal region-containing protein [Thermodesulfobacteriota bacterium]|nr:AsmA-like C-terminal region-containing protein [Thermodesulfobacteriota bacterium]
MTQTANNRGSGSSRTIIKVILILVVVVFNVGLIAFLVLPPLISSKTGQTWVTSAASESLQRPVSLGDLSFSWWKGIWVDNLVIVNKDRSPLLNLDEGRIDVQWLPLIAGRVVIRSLELNGFSATIVRDRTGRTSIDDLLGKKEEKPGRVTEEKRKEVPAIFLDAHLKNGQITFVDQRLSRKTEIRDLAADLAVPSLAESINLTLQGNIVIDNQRPKPLSIVGKALIAPEGRIDPEKARGTLDVTAHFATVHADFDLSRLDTAADSPAVKAAGTIDLGKTADVAAGIVGLPPGLAVRGLLKTSLTAQGRRDSAVTVQGQTRVTDLMVIGGPFSAAPLRQAQLDFLQTVTIDSAADAVTIKPVSLKSAQTSLALNGMVTDFDDHPTYDLDLSGTGDLYELTGIARAMAILPADLEVKGTAAVDLAAKGKEEALQITGSTKIERLAATAPWLTGKPLEEKLLDIRPDLLVNIPENRVSVNKLQINGTALALGAQGTWAAAGATDIKANLVARLGELKQQVSSLLPEAFPTRGTLSSSLRVQGNPSTSLSVSGEHVLADAILSTASGGASPLPKTTVSHELDYSQEQDRLTVKKLTGNSDVFSFNGSGTISQLSQEPRIASQIKAQVILEKAVSTLAGMLPKELSAQGNADVDLTMEGTVPESSETPLLSTWTGKGTVSTGAVTYQGVGSIEQLKTSQLVLNAGKAALAAECLVNKGPTQFTATADLTKKKPGMTITSEGKAIALTQSIKLLGYIIPIFIGPSGTLSGEGSYSLQAAWEGFDWDTDMSRTITGKGELRLADGTIQSQGVLYQILRSFDKRESFSFDEITSTFHMGEGMLYNDKTQVKGEDLDFSLQGWTSLVYVPAKEGNPMEHTVSGDFVSRLGEDAQKTLSALGGGTEAIPIVIAGTVQDPKVTVKMPKVRDILKGLTQPSEPSEEKQEGSPGVGDFLRRLQERRNQQSAPEL